MPGLFTMLRLSFVTALLLNLGEFRPLNAPVFFSFFYSVFSATFTRDPTDAQWNVYETGRCEPALLCGAVKVFIFPLFVTSSSLFIFSFFWPEGPKALTYCLRHNWLSNKTNFGREKEFIKRVNWQAVLSTRHRTTWILSENDPGIWNCTIELKAWRKWPMPNWNSNQFSGIAAWELIQTCPLNFDFPSLVSSLFCFLLLYKFLYFCYLYF